MKPIDKKIAIEILGLVLTSVLVWAETTLKITEQPEDQTVAEGDSVTFNVKVEGDSNISMDMVWCPPGTFIMGSPENELGRWDDETQHSITISNGFWIGKYEVTQAQYKAIMGSNPAFAYGIGDNYPVYSVSWNDAINFCIKLTEMEQIAGRLPEGYEYTLPTEAQWEYACRAGTSTALNSGKNLTNKEKCPNMDELGWYYYNSGNSTYPVGLKKPNNWGLYDMHGNVWEWCMDWYSPSYTNPSTGSYHVMRGGSWHNNARRCRSADRYRRLDNDCYDRGFRVALSTISSTLPPEKKQDFNVPLGETLTYQWYKDKTAINGANDSSYTIDEVKKSDEGNYTVTVSDGSTSVTSREAKLVISKLSISMYQVIDSGGYQNAIVSAGADEPLIPLADEAALEAHLEEVSQGIAADGVTPLVFSVTESGKTTEDHTYQINLSVDEPSKYIEGIERRLSQNRH